MIKYTHKMLWLYIFLAYFLLACNKDNTISIQYCGILKYSSYCHNYLQSLVVESYSKKYPYTLEIHYGFTNDYSNMLHIVNKDIDFAFFSYDLFKINPSYQPYIKEITPVEKIFLKPLLAIVKASSPYFSIKDLNKKNIAIFEHQDNIKAIQYVLDTAKISYNISEHHVLDIPFLLKEGSIDMIACFSFDCLALIDKMSSIIGKIRLIPLSYKETKKSPYDKVLYNQNIDLSLFLNIENPKIKTVGTWQYLIAHKDIEPQKIETIQSILQFLDQKN